MDWNSVLDAIRGPTKQRLQALETLHGAIEQGRTRLDREQLCDFVDAASDLLTDSNFKVAQCTLQILSVLVNSDGDVMRQFVNVLVPVVTERLGDARQPVRQEACELLLDLFRKIKPELMLEKMNRFWTHRAWKVRHGMLQTLAEAVNQKVPGILSGKDQGEYVITQVVNLVEDPNEAVRDAALDCLQEMYAGLGQSLLDKLVQQNIRPAVFKEVIARLDKIAPTHIEVQEAAAPPSTSTSGRRSASGEAAGSRPDSAALAGPAPRKGGYKDKDTGGVGDLQEVPPIHVGSDRELASELEAMAAPLSGTTFDWQQRIVHMQRLQGLAQGCGPSMHDALLECLKPLKDPLTKQLEDRRSAVNKHACHTLGVLSSVLGTRFQDYLLYFLPVLFKVLPITIQVMAEASDNCVRVLLGNCQVLRAVGVVVQAASKDKNAKIRGMCCQYVVQILESWDPSTLARCTEDIEACMRTATQDASGDARAAARCMFAAYQAVLPDQASSFFRKLDGSLQEKLNKAAVSEAPKRAAIPKPFLSRAPSAASMASSHGADSDIIIMAAPPRPQSSGLLLQPARGAMAAPPVAHQRSSSSSSGNDMPPPPPVPADRRPSNSRKSMAAPGRVLGNGLEQLSLDPYAGTMQPPTTDLKPQSSRARRSSVQAYGATGLNHGVPQRVPHATPAPATRTTDMTQAISAKLVTSPGNSGYFTVDMLEPAVGAAPAPMPLPRPSTNAAAVLGGGALKESDLISLGLSAPKPMGVSKVATALLAGPKAWNEKVELLNALTDALHNLGGEGGVDSTQSLPSDPTRDIERLSSKFLEWLEEPHFKVAVAALEALRECMCVCPHGLENALERILPALFTRLLDQKDQVRGLAAEVLQEAAVQYPADILLAGLIRSLEANKQPKAKMVVLEFAAAHIGFNCPAGVPSPHSTLLKQWLTKCSPLLTDKNAELRKRTCDAVEAAFRNVDPNAVLMFVQHSSGADGMAMKRLIASLTGSADSGSAPAPTQPQQGMGGSLGSSTTGLASSSGSGTAGAPWARPAANAQAGSTSPVLAPGVGPRSYPLMLNEFGGQGSLGDSGAGGGGALVGTRAAPVAYQAADYMSPIKVDPAKLSSIGPIHADTAIQARGTSDPGAPQAVGGVFSFPTLAQPLGSTSISAAGAVSTSAAPAVVQVGAQIAAASGMPGPAVDLGAQMRLLSLLTHRLSSGQSCAETLAQLVDATHKMAQGPWEAQAGALMTVLVTKVCTSPDDNVREMGMLLVQQLALRQPLLFRAPSILDVLLPALIAAEADKCKEVMLAASHAINTVVAAAPAHKLLDILTLMLPPHVAISSNTHTLNAGGEKLCAVCRCVQRVAHGMQPDDLAVRVPRDVLPGLKAVYEHVRADVRKACVFAIAEIWHKVGDARFDHYAQALGQTMMPLVEWAYRRILEAAPK